MRKGWKFESRRKFMATITGGLGFWGTARLLLAGTDLTKQESGAVLTTLDVKEPRLQQVGGFILVKKTSAGDLLVVRSGESQYSAFSIVCPHLQCNIKVKSSTLIQCPCHQSGYTIDGNYISGPAKRGLNKFAVSVEGNVIKVVRP